MMDEPSLGLAPLIVKIIFDIVKTINAEGVTVLLVEQNAKAALEIADYGLRPRDRARSRSMGPARSSSQDDRVRRAYLGEAHG